MTSPVSTETSQPEVAKTPEHNVAQMRKLLEQQRQENEALRQKASQLEAERERFVGSSKAMDDDFDSSEPYVDPKTLKKSFSKFKEEISKDINKQAKEIAHGMLEEERRNSYLKENADFNEIMAPEVVQKFAEKHPRMAEAILRMPDGFERQRLVYESIKTTASHQKEEAQPSIQQKIDQNKRSPFYQPSGVGAAPYAAAGDFSPTGQKAAHAKMQELKSRLRLG